MEYSAKRYPVVVLDTASGGRTVSVMPVSSLNPDRVPTVLRWGDIGTLGLLEKLVEVLGVDKRAIGGEYASGIAFGMSLISDEAARVAVDSDPVAVLDGLVYSLRLEQTVGRARGYQLGVRHCAKYVEALLYSELRAGTGGAS
jgi:hypothetical protein